LCRFKEIEFYHPPPFQRANKEGTNVRVKYSHSMRSEVIPAGVIKASEGQTCLLCANSTPEPPQNPFFGVSLVLHFIF
jgi:hypothetical protein